MVESVRIALRDNLKLCDRLEEGDRLRQDETERMGEPDTLPDIQADALPVSVGLARVRVTLGEWDTEAL